MTVVVASRQAGYTMHIHCRSPGRALPYAHGINALSRFVSTIHDDKHNFGCRRAVKTTPQTPRIGELLVQANV